MDTEEGGKVCTQALCGQYRRKDRRPAYGVHTLVESALPEGPAPGQRGPGDAGV